MSVTEKQTTPLFFTPFTEKIASTLIPERLLLMGQDEEPHPLCVLAAADLQQYLATQTAWKHNFGLSGNTKETVIGKMFGVLVVQNKNDEIGYLAAFSGKLGNSNHYHRFVPPVFDLLTADGFLGKGMKALAERTAEINRLTALDDKEKILLKKQRQAFSKELQQQIFEHYHFLNQAGEEKSLIELFTQAGYKNPPAGAGECAGPKLLQYAYQHQMKPLALAEFWWGQSPKSTTWKHGNYYPCCKEKCEPILAHMLARADRF